MGTFLRETFPKPGWNYGPHRDGFPAAAAWMVVSRPQSVMRATPQSTAEVPWSPLSTLDPQCAFSAVDLADRRYLK